MKFDSTLTISIVLALVALIAPTITARVNNRHTYKMKKLEIQEKRYEQQNSHIKQLFEKFLSDYGAFSSTYLVNDRNKAAQSFYSCLAYVPEKKLDSFLHFYNSFTKTGEPLKAAEKYMQETSLNEIRDILKSL